MEIINGYTIEFRSIPSIDRTLANRYNQKLEDIQDWLSKTRWSQKQLEIETLEKVSRALHDLELIDDMISTDKILWQKAYHFCHVAPTA